MRYAFIDQLSGTYIGAEQIWPRMHNVHAKHRTPGMSEQDDLVLVQTMRKVLGEFSIPSFW